MASLHEYYDRATQGRFIVDQSELPVFLLQMIRGAREEILASSYAQPAIWWEQPWGKEYEKENYDAVKRNVKVRRTFIFRTEDERAAIQHLLDRQLKAGIPVKYALERNLRSHQISGLVCIDNRLAGELRMTAEKGIKEAEFYTRPDDILTIRNRIDQISAQANNVIAPTT